MWNSALCVKYRRSKINIISSPNGSKMDGSLVSSNFSLVYYYEGTPSTKDKDPMVLSQSYMMYKIGKFLYQLSIKSNSIKVVTFMHYIAKQKHMYDMRLSIMTLFI